MANRFNRCCCGCKYCCCNWMESFSSAPEFLIATYQDSTPRYDCTDSCRPFYPARPCNNPLSEQQFILYKRKPLPLLQYYDYRGPILTDCYGRYDNDYGDCPVSYVGEHVLTKRIAETSVTGTTCTEKCLSIYFACDHTRAPPLCARSCSHGFWMKFYWHPCNESPINWLKAPWIRNSGGAVCAPGPGCSCAEANQTGFGKPMIPVGTSISNFPVDCTKRGSVNPFLLYHDKSFNVGGVNYWERLLVQLPC